MNADQEILLALKIKSSILKVVSSFSSCRCLQFLVVMMRNKVAKNAILLAVCKYFLKIAEQLYGVYLIAFLLDHFKIEETKKLTKNVEKNFSSLILKRNFNEIYKCLENKCLLQFELGAFVLENLEKLAVHETANYIVQKLLENSAVSFFLNSLRSKIINSFSMLSTDMYGSFVVSKMIFLELQGKITNKKITLLALNKQNLFPLVRNVSGRGCIKTIIKNLKTVSYCGLKKVLR